MRVPLTHVIPTHPRHSREGGNLPLRPREPHINRIWYNTRNSDPTQAERNETRKQYIETSVHPLGVPIRRRRRSGSDRLRRRPSPRNPDHRARRDSCQHTRTDAYHNSHKHTYADTHPNSLQYTYAHPDINSRPHSTHRQLRRGRLPCVVTRWKQDCVHIRRGRGPRNLRDECRRLKCHPTHRQLRLG